MDSDIIGCANFGNISSTSRTGFVGGICGRIYGFKNQLGIDATIRDCYNVGMVTGGSAGGITGQSDSSNIDILIANCYNVGSLRGSNYTGEIIGSPSSAFSSTTIDNCYYLPTGNPASTSNRVIVKRTGSKSAEDFADGTVLKLLIDGRDNSPWDSACKYLDGKTLPVLAQQKLTAHGHNWGAWTSNGDGNHSRTCACGVTETAKCSGGTATRTAKAVCQVCGQPYGQLASGGGIRRQPTGGSGAANTSNTTKTVKSGNTGDMGVMLYAGMALLSLTGGAWVLGKKRK